MSQRNPFAIQLATTDNLDHASQRVSGLNLVPADQAGQLIVRNPAPAANNAFISAKEKNKHVEEGIDGTSNHPARLDYLDARGDLLPSATVPDAISSQDSTVLPSVAAERTDETDKTDLRSISNTEFLAAIFNSLEEDARPMVCSVVGNPTSAPGVSWRGRPWLPGSTRLDAGDHNWYFSLSSFNPDPSGGYRRQKKYFAALSAIMLDDIGTKAAGRDRLNSLPPTWLIETSPGNFQAGYAFCDPVTDPAVATALMSAVIKAGLCDKGANGPLTRYARLPVATNGKHTPAFDCRLIEWRPECRYRPEEIVDAFQLDLKKRSTVPSTSPLPRSGMALDSSVYVPRPSENPVIAALKEGGLYKRDSGSGKHEITCPWVHEHTEGVDSGTTYFAPDEAHPVGGFKCHHGHCAERTIYTLLDNLGVEHSLARHRSVIRTVQGELNRIVDAAERELASTGEYFQRAGMIVRVVNDPATRQTTIKEVNGSALLRALATTAYWERFDKRMGQFQATDPPPNYVNVLSSAQEYPHLPALYGIARQPYLRSDGSLMSEPGYDKATGMYGVFNADDFAVPDECDREGANEALTVLNNLLAEFAFATESDRSAAIAGMLTAAIRPSLPQAPMFHVRAPQISSGKSYLTTLISTFASPNRTPAASFPTSDEECQKMLLAMLVEAPAVVCFDNLVTDLLPHKTLCSTLTDEFINGRVLGHSRTATVGTRVLFLSSGNNVGPIRDMTRRCVTIMLDPACETPASRVFRGDPVGEVMRDRGSYVSAALQIIRAWIHAGRPMSACRSIASYGEWSDLVRQPLLWLGLPDPAESIFRTMAVDPDTETLGRLLHAWERVFGNRPTMVRDVVGKASRHSTDPDRNELYDVISDIAEERGEINRKRLGRWIDRHAGRFVDGLRFVRAAKTCNAVPWQIESTPPAPLAPLAPSVSSVSSVPPAASVIEISDDRIAEMALD